MTNNNKDIYFNLRGYIYSIPFGWEVINAAGKRVLANNLAMGEEAIDPMLGPEEDGYHMGARCENPNRQ